MSVLAVPEVTIWTDAHRAPLVAALLEVMGATIKPLGVGGPRGATVDDLAASLGCPREDDLRKLVVEHPAAYLLLATMASISVEELAAVVGHDTIVLSVEPVAADLSEWALLGSKGTGTQADGTTNLGLHQRIVLVPAFRQCPGFLSAADPFDFLGHGRLIGLESCGRSNDGSLFARLFDSWKTVLGFIDLPERIDASLTGPLGEASEDLRDLTGRLAAHARASGDCAAALIVSNQAGQAHRRLHVIAAKADLRISDWDYELRPLDGTTVDLGRAVPEGIGVVDLIAAEWRRLLDRPHLLPVENPTQNGVDALACCLACLLSARTGEPESPRNILEMNR